MRLAFLKGTEQPSHRIFFVCSCSWLLPYRLPLPMDDLIIIKLTPCSWYTVSGITKNTSVSCYHLFKCSNNLNVSFPLHSVCQGLRGDDIGLSLWQHHTVLSMRMLQWVLWLGGLISFMAFPFHCPLGFLHVYFSVWRLMLLFYPHKEKFFVLCSDHILFQANLEKNSPF